MDKLPGEATLPFSILFPSQYRSTLKGKNLLLLRVDLCFSKSSLSFNPIALLTAKTPMEFLAALSVIGLRVDHFEMDFWPREANRKKQKLFLLLKV